jgi:ABC-type antimicrobial peptide transport system permease subunit
MIADLRRALAELDPKLPLYSVDTVENLIDSSLMDRRTPTLLAVSFAAVALLLATIGVYSVVAYQVSQRRREIGIRMALGADSPRIFCMVLIEGGLIIGLGISAGLTLSTLTQRTIESQLYGVQPMEVSVVLAVISTLTVAALLAIVGPARRAARISPSIALVEA